MRKYILLLFLSVSTFGIGQTVNDYKYVIVPEKFSFFKENNKYDLNALTEFLFQKYGFQTIMSDQDLPPDLASNRCAALLANVEETNGFLITKLKITLKNCTGKLLFEGTEGRSKEKDFKRAYTEALRNAFKSVEALNYKYSGQQVVAAIPENQLVSSVKVSHLAVQTEDTSIVKANKSYLFAQPIPNGYQLVDNIPKVVLKIYNTLQEDNYIAISDQYQGVLYKKEAQWFLEYYKLDKHIVETLLIKF